MSSDDVSISVAIMHHPLRAEMVAGLVAAAAELEPQVVADPDPHGIRSPLRTAKVAWRTIAVGATHHLVLQDDVELCDGFPALLVAAVEARPTHAVALYTDWNSPQNAYLVRRACAVGAAWAPLSWEDWAPAVAFLLPVAHAEALAAYLARIPDEVVDDDEMISRFCWERRLPIVATVPHLVDKRAVATLTGHQDVYHATVFASSPELPVDHWTGDALVDVALHARFGSRDRIEHVLEIRGGRCVLRLLRPGPSGPPGEEFGWYWHDWCDLVGVGAERVVRAALRDLGISGGSDLEAYAAGFLLGADVAGFDATGQDPWLTPALRSWVVSGMTWSAGHLPDIEVERLTDIARRAVAAGQRDGTERAAAS